MKKRKRCLQLVAFIATAFLTGCNNGTRDWEQIKEEGKLRVAMDYNKLGMIHQGDTTVGVQYDMVNKMCNDLGLKADIKIDGDLSSCQLGLENGEYDLIAHLIPITTQLKDNNLQFTHQICRDKQVLVQRKPQYGNDSAFVKSQLDLPGHCITMPQNSPYIARLKNLEIEIGDTIHIAPVERYQSEQLVILVAKGDIDYTVCKQSLAKRLAKTYPQLDYSTGISFSQMQAWAVRKDADSLLAKINNWLDQNADNYFK